MSVASATDQDFAYRIREAIQRGRRFPLKNPGSYESNDPNRRAISVKRAILQAMVELEIAGSLGEHTVWVYKQEQGGQVWDRDRLYPEGQAVYDLLLSYGYDVEIRPCNPHTERTWNEGGGAVVVKIREFFPG
jgi:hypothetical protein